MKLTSLIRLNAILWMGLGIAFALYGPVMMGVFAVTEVVDMTAMAYWNVAAFARMFGAALFGFGLLLWALRSLATDPHVSAEARRGVLFSLVLANLMGLGVAITQQVSVWGSAAGWVTTALFALLTLAYGYLLAKMPSEPEKVQQFK